MDSAEDATIAQLRDALILASAATGGSLADMAPWVTRHLAIDAEMSTCQKTTRVAQAIETLQNILMPLLHAGSTVGPSECRKLSPLPISTQTTVPIVHES